MSSFLKFGMTHVAPQTCSPPRFGERAGGGAREAGHAQLGQNGLQTYQCE